MRVFDVEAARLGVLFDRRRDRHTFLWCAGPRSQDALVAAFGLEAECGATALVPGTPDDRVYGALGGLGWTRDATGGPLRCPEHA